MAANRQWTRLSVWPRLREGVVRNNRFQDFRIFRTLLICLNYIWNITQYLIICQEISICTMCEKDHAFLPGHGS